MRLKLTLRPKDKKCMIPINYQYPISAFIYKMLYSSSKEYAIFLHRNGYISEKGKPLKLFNFSYLFSQRKIIKRRIIEFINYPLCTLYISSPITSSFIENLLIGLFDNREIVIGNKYVVGRFNIIEIESLKQPDLTKTTYFKCLSPFVVSIMKNVSGKLMPYYLRANDPKLGEKLNQNLVQKFKVIYKKNPENLHINFKIDKEYIHRKGGEEKVAKLITIKENEYREQTQIKSILAPFTLSNNTELAAIAWECGIGEKNSLGFGMIDLVTNNAKNG